MINMVWNFTIKWRLGLVNMLTILIVISDTFFLLFSSMYVSITKKKVSLFIKFISTIMWMEHFTILLVLRASEND